MAEMFTKIVLRNDTSENWALANPILLKGETGIEYLNNKEIKIKIGDGVTPWVELPYFGGDHGDIEKVLKDIVDKLKASTLSKKYEITDTPVGTLVDYGDTEIRIMCPADANFTQQQVGEGGDPNNYYITFTTYAPEEAVTFKEGDQGVIIDEVLDFENTASAGIDKYGRKYKKLWLAVARRDATTGQWTYYGKNSTTRRYIGWTYVVEWYNDKGVKIGFDSIRINLSNESCHNNNEPYFMGSINIDKLSQNEGQYLHLYGGSATDNI